MAPNMPHSEPVPCKAEASSKAVVAYVAQSPKSPAAKAATNMGALNLLNKIKAPKPTKEPTTAIETILAPQVLMPPCARNRAWIRRASAPRTVLRNRKNRDKKDNGAGYAEKRH